MNLAFAKFLPRANCHITSFRSIATQFVCLKSIMYLSLSKTKYKSLRRHICVTSRRLGSAGDNNQQCFPTQNQEGHTVY